MARGKDSIRSMKNIKGSGKDLIEIGTIAARILCVDYKEMNGELIVRNI